MFHGVSPASPHIGRNMPVGEVVKPAVHARAHKYKVVRARVKHESCK